ncbi:putative nuclease HARBI1 [Heterodontus francisci]|uniref:putative nuclease HARBI1 n=1 Tax=Heterodontus francisci TaxID=7792 RepID=UPI00355C2B75
MGEGEKVTECPGCNHPAGRVYRLPLNFLQLSEHQCRRLCLSQETVTSLCEMLGAEVASNCVGGHPMPVALKLTVALNFYASGSFQASSGAMCGVSQASAHHCIKVMADAIFRRANQFIKFKTDATSQAKTARSLSTIAGFPMAQGVIDCTHVAITAPTGVCSLSWKQSRCIQFLELPVPALFSPPECLQGWILGDRGYLLKTWLLTPVRNPRTEAEERYNESQATTRVTREQIIGFLKMRFRCLDRSSGALQYSPARVCRIIVVCCALHNLVMERGEALEDDQVQRKASSDEDGDTDEEEEPQPHKQQGEGAGGLGELSERESPEAPILRSFS